MTRSAPESVFRGRDAHVARALGALMWREYHGYLPCWSMVRDGLGLLGVDAPVEYLEARGMALDLGPIRGAEGAARCAPGDVLIFEDPGGRTRPHLAIVTGGGLALHPGDPGGSGRVVADPVRLLDTAATPGRTLRPIALCAEGER